jgi:hypothetical protein
MRLFLVLLFGLCLLVAGITVFVWSGVYNVSARAPHWSITFWFLEKVREQSISAHGRTTATLSSENPERINIGFRNYHAMCRTCHSAPGYAQTEVAKGLYPQNLQSTNRKMCKGGATPSFTGSLKMGSR